VPALGASPATIYRRRRPPEPRASKPRPTPARALSEPERERVLEVLHSERFVDVLPKETWATLLDEGTYLCSTRPSRIHGPDLPHSSDSMGALARVVDRDRDSLGRLRLGVDLDHDRVPAKAQ
jgi:hypothetical protein